MVVLGDEAMDGGFELVDGMECAALEAALAELGEKRLDGIEPRGGHRHEVEGPARVVGEPGEDGGMFMGGVVVDHRVNRFAAGDARLKGIEQADEVLMPVVPRALADELAFAHIKGCEQRCGAVTLVIMRYGAGATRLLGQAGQSRAWIWLFSSTDNTTAWADGST